MRREEWWEGLAATGRQLDFERRVGVKLSRLEKKTRITVFFFVSVSGFKKRKEKAKNIVQASEEVQFPSKGVNLQETTRPHRDWTAVGAGFRARKKASLCKNNRPPTVPPLCFIPCCLEAEGNETTTKTKKSESNGNSVNYTLYTSSSM